MSQTMKVLVVTVAFVACVLAGGTRVHSAVSVLMSGLDNPRGLAFGPEGGLYVVEAGRGGTGPCAVLRGLNRCYGPSGAISRYFHGVQERVATGLPSYAGTDGEATGPHDIAFQGRGGAFVTVGMGGDPAVVRGAFGAQGALFGTLLQVPPSGKWRPVTDVSAYEATVNPHPTAVDSNPYGVLALPGKQIVADAGANALLEIHANGDMSTLAVFPARPTRSTDAVPTAVVVGPDGAYYVSELTGVPFAENAARIYRVVPGNAPEVYLTGFKTVIDLDFGPDGSLYVLEHATGATFFGGPGRVIRVEPDGDRSIAADNLTRPSSVLIGDDGTIYVSNRGISIGTGQVLMIQ